MNFKEYLKKVLMLESSASDETNKHLTHLDEYILVHGKEGGIKTVKYIENLLGILHSDTDKPINTTVKWDGAPAVVVGTFNGKFFVSSKSAFNANPVLNFSIQEIKKNHSGKEELIQKLSTVFNTLNPYANLFDGAYQGDLLFTKNSLKYITIDGVPSIAFRPNTILYSVNTSSAAGQRISQSEVGIVFHTRYTVQYDYGKNPNNDISGTIPQNSEPLQEPKIVFTNKQFGINVDRLKSIPEVYITDALFEDKAGVISLTNNESLIIKKGVSMLKFFLADIMFRSLSKSLTRVASKNITVLNSINTFLNYQIKRGVFINNIDDTFEEYVAWLSGELDKDAIKYKKIETQKKKERYKNRALKVIRLTKPSIKTLFKFIKTVKFIKDIFIQKYNDIVRNQSIKSYLKQPNGDIVATNPEGYVAFDSDQNGVKFIDRLEFSRANFNMPKEWGNTQPPQESNLENNEEEEVTEAVIQDNVSSIAIMPGGFKPPHKGHFEALKYLIEQGKVQQAIVYIGKGDRGLNITPEKSLAIWKVYRKYIPIEDTKIDVEVANISPVKSTYDFAEQNINSNLKIYVGAGVKDLDRYKSITNKEKYGNVEIIPIPDQYGRISATEVRSKISEDIKSAIEFFVPEGMKLKDKKKIISILTSENAPD